MLTGRARAFPPRSGRPGDRTMRRRMALPAALAVALVVTAASLSGCGAGRGGRAPGGGTGVTFAAGSGLGPSVQADIRAFFGGYVGSDGRVFRPGNGNDTVSEGQAYAMLLAVAGGDRNEFDRVWAWTRRHLQRPDHLLAWHWAGGKVLDYMPASDADLETAWALDLAARRFDEPALAGAAREMSAAILGSETAATRGGLILVAGPWARANPAVVDPSYLSLPAFQALGSLTGDPRWAQLFSTSLSMLERLTSDPARLPPDWATVTPQGSVSDSGPPGGTPTPAYGLDAARTIVWLAATCSAAPHVLSGRAWPLLSQTALSGQFASSLSLGGKSNGGKAAPLIAIADAAAAATAGHSRQANALVIQADRVARQNPGYYGAAWAALGRVLLITRSLGTCPPI